MGVHAKKSSLFTEGLAPYEIFNLGNNQPEKLMDMIHYLGDALDVELQMEMLSMQPRAGIWGASGGSG